jgi:hypothetical protein
MRLRAHITIDIDAADFVSAADHQRRVESILDIVKQDYAQAHLELRERRERTEAPANDRPIKPGRPTGALNLYEDFAIAASS